MSNGNARISMPEGAASQVASLEVNDPRGDFDPANKRWVQQQIGTMGCQYIIPTADRQTEFGLSLDLKEDEVSLSVNGQDQRVNADFTIVEGILKWLSRDFPLERSDTLKLSYFK